MFHHHASQQSLCTNFILKYSNNKVFAVHSNIIFLESNQKRNDNNQSLSMRNNFNFEGHIQAIKYLTQQTIKTAQISNVYLKSMSKSVIRRAVKELRYQYQEQYLKKDGEKLQMVISALNLIAKQQVNSSDELFIALGNEVNTFYEYNHIDLKKSVPYFLKCRFCHKNVSNYQLGKKIHESKCFKSQVAIHQESQQKKIKMIDTPEKFQKRQNKLSQGITAISVEDRESKKEQLQAKKAQKTQKLLQKCQSQDECSSQYAEEVDLQSFGQEEEFFFSDDDLNMEKDQKTQEKISSSQLMRQIENVDRYENEQNQDGYFN